MTPSAAHAVGDVVLEVHGRLATPFAGIGIGLAALVAIVLIVNPKNPHHYLTIDGVVEDIVDEDDPERGHLATENIDAHSEKYLGTSPYPLRDSKGEVRVMYALRPTRILTFGPVEG